MRLVINHLIWHHHLQPRRQHGAYLLLTADNGPPNKEIYHRPQVYYYRTVNQFSLDPVRRLQRQPAFALIRSWLALGDQALFFFFLPPRWYLLCYISGAWIQFYVYNTLRSANYVWDAYFGLKQTPQIIAAEGFGLQTSRRRLNCWSATAAQLGDSFS